MQTNETRLTALNAGDVMSRDVVTIAQSVSMWEAIDILIKRKLSEAPVVDENGKCVGVLSAVDFMRAARGDTDACLVSCVAPAACSFQKAGRTQAGERVVVCTLPSGTCPIQKKAKDAEGKEMAVCTEPHGVLTDWQSVGPEDTGANEVRRHMTADPIKVSPSMSVKVLAKRMIDGRIHRIIVVDDLERPIGVVSSIDILAVVAIGNKAAP